MTVCYGFISRRRVQSVRLDLIGCFSFFCQAQVPELVELVELLHGDTFRNQQLLFLNELLDY